MINLDNMGFKIRSRYKENLELEKASLFHINREKKNAQSGNLDKLFIDGKVVTDRDKIEAKVTSFFGKLLTGYHGVNGELMDEPFESDYEFLGDFLEGLGELTPESRTMVETPVNRAELQIALERAENLLKTWWLSSMSSWSVPGSCCPTSRGSLASTPRQSQG